MKLRREATVMILSIPILDQILILNSYLILTSHFFPSCKRNEFRVYSFHNLAFDAKAFSLSACVLCSVYVSVSVKLNQSNGQKKKYNLDLRTEQASQMKMGCAKEGGAWEGGINYGARTTFARDML